MEALSQHSDGSGTLHFYCSKFLCQYCLIFTRQGEYIENQNFTRKENDQSVAKLFLVVSRADNHVQYSCEASNGDHFPSVSQKTNFSVNNDDDDFSIWNQSVVSDTSFLPLP